MKLEETENLKLQYANNIQTTTTQIKKIRNSDTDLSKKITKVLNIYEKTQILKVNHHSKNGVTFAEDTEIALLNANKNSKTIKVNHKKTKNQINHFTST